eukprot:CAMPEP_0194050380 /NCGR_PEP_ID=MMETSP0009_2-20130614/35006_1 /TAXON_ID=210454 /ORGANISM="Grammatophora oceanica, Strain CCMP 410" /LENGTH=89 /DNA_ID=CAMNT_0038696981 /DNA_START=241 /DNA_END=510 /DNA_ORIENTATION=+
MKATLPVYEKTGTSPSSTCDRASPPPKYAKSPKLRNPNPGAISNPRTSNQRVISGSLKTSLEAWLLMSIRGSMGGVWVKSYPRSKIRAA